MKNSHNVSERRAFFCTDKKVMLSKYREIQWGGGGLALDPRVGAAAEVIVLLCLDCLQ